MDIVAILIGLAITGGVVAYVAQPLVRKPKRAVGSSGESPQERLENEYRVALEALRELDFDFQTGKVLEEDYRSLRGRYVTRGTALLKELDQFEMVAPAGGDARGRAARKPRKPVLSDDIEAMVKARRRSRSPSPRSCPACGHPCQPGDRFCGKCGTFLEAKA